jgi:DNA-binding SARP family transcriptional activator
MVWRFAVAVDGLRIEGALPGRGGRLLFAYLVLNRGRPLLRDELLMAGWGQDAPTEARSALMVRRVCRDVADESHDVVPVHGKCR